MAKFVKLPDICYTMAKKILRLLAKCVEMQKTCFKTATKPCLGPPKC